MINTVLETERLILRPLQAGDEAAITRHAGDRRIAAGKLDIPHPCRRTGRSATSTITGRPSPRARTSAWP